MRGRRGATVLAGLTAMIGLLAGCSATPSPSASSPSAATSRPTTGTVTSTIAYGSASPAQTLLLTRPRHPIDPGRSPWLLLVHGGGWIAGNPGQMAASTALLTAHGYVVVSAGYRLLDDRTTFAQQWSDVVHAWSWVRTHAAQLGVDPGRGAVWGASAGGHLAAMLGNRQPGVRAVVTLAGGLEPSYVAQLAFRRRTPRAGDDHYLHDATRTPTWLYSVLAERVVRRPWLPSDPAVVTAWTAVDPGHYLHRGSPAALVVQGTADQVVPPGTAARYAAQCAALGVPHETVMVPGAGHAEPGLVAAAGARALTFLRERLLDVRSR